MPILPLSKDDLRGKEIYEITVIKNLFSLARYELRTKGSSSFSITYENAVNTITEFIVWCEVSFKIDLRYEAEALIHRLVKELSEELILLNSKTKQNQV